MPDLVLSYDPGGSHHIAAMWAGQRVPLLTVRPVGVFEFDCSGEGITHGSFAPEWTPDIIAALQLAQRIAAREKPWERYEEEPELYGVPEPKAGE